ncbi:MAG: hypothetical protein MUF58_12950 [Arcicella sp.]|nr:hypothetical protein [Arcicella sp.]
MKIELIKSSLLSGNYATIYDVVVDGGKTLFERFIEENIDVHKQEIKNILDKLQTIGKETGARLSHFKENEGSLGDGVCAMFDLPDKKLRLYCIRYGTEIIILGGGGIKHKHIRAYQEAPKLDQEASLIKKIAKEINQQIKDKDIEYSDDFMEFEGDLIFEID